MAAMNPPSIIVLAEAALKTAERVRTLYPGAEIFGRAGRISDCTPFDDTGTLLRQLFAENRPIIGICAAGKYDRCGQGCNYDRFSHEWSSLINAAIESCPPID